MPLDVLGRTRATLTHAASLPCPKGPGNLVNASHQLALITSLPFVHTARRTYRLNDSVKLSDRGQDALGRLDRGKLFKPHHLEEGEVVTRFP